jgi:hypothetical protein
VREPVRPLLGLDPADVPNLPASALPGVLVALAALQTAVAAQLTVLPRPAEPLRAEREPRQTGKRWLTVPQAAERVGKDPRYVYRRLYALRDPWDFMSKDGRTVLISEEGLVQWMERHRVRNGL